LDQEKILSGLRDSSLRKKSERLLQTAVRDMELERVRERENEPWLKGADKTCAVACSRFESSNLRQTPSPCLCCAIGMEKLSDDPLAHERRERLEPERLGRSLSDREQ
jgi:hypothetical protein